MDNVPIVDDALIAAERTNDGKTHVVVSHYIDASNPNMEQMLFRIELWPLPQLIGDAICKELAELAMKRLSEAGLGREGEWNQEEEDSPVSPFMPASDNQTRH